MYDGVVQATDSKETSKKLIQSVLLLVHVLLFFLYIH